MTKKENVNENKIGNIIINQAGDDQIKLEQNTKGQYMIKITHNCKIVGQGIEYLNKIHPDVIELLNKYNGENEKKKVDEEKK